MAQAIELIPLVCLRCSTPIPAMPVEVAWVCAQCGQGMRLDESGLQPLQVTYASNIPPGATGKPFWVADGRVTVQRETYGGNQNRESEQFWSQPRRFFIPAFASTLENLLAVASNLLLTPPALQPGPAARFEPVTLSPENVFAAAEFLVVAIEAGRKDQLKRINFNLQLSDPTLWILPA